MKYCKNDVLKLTKDFQTLGTTINKDEEIIITYNDYLMNSYDICTKDERYIFDIPSKDLENNSIVLYHRKKKNFVFKILVILFVIFIIASIMFLIFSCFNHQIMILPL